MPGARPRDEVCGADARGAGRWRWRTADGGGGGQVEALGPAVDRQRDEPVQQGRTFRRQAPGLVAQHPQGRPGQLRRTAPSSSRCGRRPRRRRAPAGRRRGPAATASPRSAPTHEGQVEQAARCWPGRSWGCTASTESPVTRTASAPKASAQRITVPRLPGSRIWSHEHDQPRRTGQRLGQGDVDGAADRDDALRGDRVGQLPSRGAPAHRDAVRRVRSAAAEQVRHGGRPPRRRPEVEHDAGAGQGLGNGLPALDEEPPARSRSFGGAAGEPTASRTAGATRGLRRQCDVGGRARWRRAALALDQRARRPPSR